jgi:FtsH-binding integral membrane protein
MTSIIITQTIKKYEKSAVKSALIMVAILFCLVSTAAYLFQESLEDSNISLTVTLIFLALNMVYLFSRFDDPFLTKILSIALIGIVCYFILIQTKDLYKNGKECISPDYIDEASGFFVHAHYIFYKLLNLESE